MRQVLFTDKLACKSFVLNKMALNMKNCKSLTCMECRGDLLDHSSTAVSEDDVAAYLSLLEGRDGGHEVLESEPGLGAVFVGGRGASLRPFVTK